MKTLQYFTRMTLIAHTLIIGLASIDLQAQEVRNYSIGVVPQFESRRIIATWQPILERVGKQTGINLVLTPSPSITAFEDSLASGKFDFAYMNPYHLLVSNRQQGYLPLLRDHGTALQGIVVVKKDSSLRDISELDRKVIAFPAPNALGASLMVRADLMELHKISIEPRYVKNHTSVYLSVATGVVDAGGGIQETLNQQSLELQSELRVIYRTETVPPHPLAVHPRVPTAVARHVQQALLSLMKDEAGRMLLAEIPVKDMGVARLDDYKLLRTMGLEKYYVKE